MQEIDRQRALTRIVERLQDIVRSPERTKFPQQVADEQTLAAIRLVIDLLPEDIRQQITEIVALRDQIHSPYLRHATEMTSLHRTQEQHTNLPSWIHEKEK